MYYISLTRILRLEAIEHASLFQQSETKSKTQSTHFDMNQNEDKRATSVLHIRIKLNSNISNETK